MRNRRRKVQEPRRSNIRCLPGAGVDRGPGVEVRNRVAAAGRTR
jgi:hypothetical protein